MRDTMIYKPERKPKKALLYIVILFIIAATCIGVLANGVNFKWLFQLMIFICLVLFIQSIIRYFIYEYKYIISNNAFSVVQISGKREKVLCNLDLSTAVGVYDAERFGHEKKNIGHIKSLYNYTQNFMPDNRFYYVFEFNGAKCCVSFETSREFADALKEKTTKEP